MAPERFHRMQLQEEFDTYDGCNTQLLLKFVTKRSKIIEIVAAKDMYLLFLILDFVLLLTEVVTNKRIAFFNLSPYEVIRSMFYNKYNGSLITVSVYSSDNYSTLKFRTTPIEYIRSNQLDSGFPLFESESVKSTGFLEFDDVNGKILAHSAQEGVYKVYSLTNYSFLYSIPDKNVQDIKIRRGFMLLIYDRIPRSVPLKIFSIEDGKLLKYFKHLLHPNKKHDFIKQLNEKLLVKQEGENLQILDVRSSGLIEVCDTNFVTPSAFIFLYKDNLFLTFWNRTVAVWNLQGGLVTSFEDHLLWDDDYSTNHIYLTNDQDRIISYCKSETEAEDGAVTPIGSINMSEIMTGKCIGKIAANDPTLSVAPRRDGCNTRSSVSCTAPEALKDVTAVFYDEDRNEIYTGNKHGVLHVWSNTSGFSFGKL